MVGYKFCDWYIYSNTVGGIYTVIKTKAAETVVEYGEQYVLFGPYNDKCAKLEVEVIENPANFAIADTLAQMRSHNIKVSSSSLCCFADIDRGNKNACTSCM